MSRPGHAASLTTSRVPRASGDEPTSYYVLTPEGADDGTNEGEARVVFPARAGMSRDKRGQTPKAPRVPRASGDEPKGDCWNIEGVKCPLHEWGACIA